ncbi:condensation domain-containing protein [Colletotrichum navitas]|uniref:Condensation domain-containing protein n=1 Tax=Colletotrichum navitas TaxID=681940 RepID=A0AAD8PMK3_9PEZI|nr:condensation domain-containing protein [Colletotrichum navitas]KAK1570027.1 condensation domain-containing protein [Colletotrichum navitas]
MFDSYQTGRLNSTIAAIGLEDEFIALGGDSDNAMKVARRCREAGLRVLTVDILSHPTIHELVRFVEARDSGADYGDTCAGHSGLAPKVYDDGDEPFVLSLGDLRLPPDLCPNNIAYVMPCTPLQEDYWHLFSTNPAPERPGVMTNCFEISRLDGLGTVDPYQAAVAWQMMADHHPMLRTRFVPLAELGVAPGRFGPLPLGTIMQVVMRRWRVDCTVVHVDSDSEQDIKQYSAVHTANSLYRAKPAACVSVRLFVTPARRVYMNVFLWHISADFVSTGVFMSDFDRFYRGILPNRPAPGFDLYVHELGLMTRRGQADVQAGTRYWIDYLHGVKSCRLLPRHLGVVDRRSSSAYSDPDGNELTCVTNLGRVSCRLFLCSMYAKYCRGSHVLPSTIFRLAYALNLSKYTGQEDVCFTYIISDRDRDIPNIDSIFGMMMTYFYVKIRATPSARLSDLMQQLHYDDLAHRRHMIYRPTDVARALGHDDEYGVLPVTNVRFNDRRLDVPRGPELGYRGVIANLVQEASTCFLCRCNYTSGLSLLTVRQLSMSLILIPSTDRDYASAHFTFKKVQYSEESVQQFADMYACIFHAVASGSFDTVADVMAHMENGVPGLQKKPS